MRNQHIALLLSLVTAAMLHAQPEASIRVAEEMAPAGGVALIQIEMTEPTPILTGDVTVGKRGAVLGNLCGLGLFSNALDVVGAATRQGDRTRIRFLGFSGQVGATPDLPVMVIAFDMSSGAALGAEGGLEIIEASLRLEAPGGTIYRNDVKQGSVTVGGVSITSVTPSNGIIPAGAQIRFRGVGFQSESRIDIDGVALSSVQVLGPTEIVAVAGQSFRIENRRIRLRNPDNTEDFFYTFSPAKLVPATANPVLRSAIPIFLPQAVSEGGLAASADLIGLSVRNRNASPTNVRIRAFDASGVQIGEQTTELAAEAESTLTLAEWLGGASVASAASYYVEANQPVQALGLRYESESFVPAILNDDPPPVSQPPNTPTINSGGWIQAPLTPIQPELAPLALTTLFGQSFAPEGFAVAAGPADLVNGRLPTRLGGVCVEIDGVTAPLFFVSSNQINLQMPAGGAGAASAVVVRGCGTVEEARSAAATATRLERNPAWFVLGSSTSGINPIAALHGGGPSIAAEATAVAGAMPAEPGEVVSLFATGLGATNPPLEAGQIPQNVLPAGGLAPVTGAVSVRVGGLTIPQEDLLYAGAAPCCAGLYQVVVRLPQQAPDGPLPVAISVDGFESPSGPYLTVQRRP